ncbi:hypothetical protein O181_023188 [Austropuccinia psidii MF-1]|uniref:Uncharacterized protein n=1 Tax=Austropuccinia psidii MF-1 TaxID=1389203 RepID=A0A9Q3GX25_9BASI|nr:hypothetical protein [Austropuccinia psidii MF-1]
MLPPELHLIIGTLKRNYYKRIFKNSKNNGKKKIWQAFQLIPEGNNAESGSFSPSNNLYNEGPQINTSSPTQTENMEIGNITNYLESLPESEAFGGQEDYNLPKENINTETQSSLFEDEIVHNQTNNNQ